MRTLIGINGAAGRMGQRLVHLAREDAELTLAAALEYAGHPAQGRDVGELCGLGPVGVPLRSSNLTFAVASSECSGSDGR